MPGTCSSGIGLAENNNRQGFAIHRASRFAFFFRALSVEIPVFAYICRYSLEMKTNASQSFKFEAQLDRVQIDLRS